MRWLLLVLLCITGIARADELNLPGLSNDASAYRQALRKTNPAGQSPQLQLQAEQRAATAAARQDWAAAATALETRLSTGDGSAPLWLALATAQLKRTPPNPARAAQAAWLAYGLSDTGAPQIAPLLALIDAFKLSDLPVQALAAIDAVLERAPDSPRYLQMQADLRQNAGLLVRLVRTEPESDPSLACIEFTSPPSRRSDVVPADWVRLQPAQPDAAVTRQADAYCIAGLPLGATTQVTLRAGLPGEGGLTLKRDTTLAIGMASRQPRLAFDQTRFLLPRHQTASIALGSINLSAVHLRLVRIGERNLVPWTRDAPLGHDNDTTPDDNGKTVWEGTAAIPAWQPNRLAHTILPLPEVMSEPGAYLLVATPGDGTPDTSTTASQTIIRTDLAPTVWRGTDGLTVQLRSFATAAPRPDVKMTLLARNNDILAEATTDADGVVRFPAPLLRGTDSQAPQSLHALAGDDLVTLDLTTAAFDLSDRGVQGQPDPGPLDAFAWTDRGVYRPGETVHLMALLRDPAGQPIGIPAHIQIKRPNGQIFLDRVPPRGGDSSLDLPVALPLSAPAGMWSADILADTAAPPIGHTTFKVDAFVPDRMAVTASPAGPITIGQPYALPMTARFLYGAPAIDLSGTATLKLTKDPAPPAALAGYRIGLDNEPFAPQSMEITLPHTDQQGRATLPILLKTAPDSTFPIHAEIDIGVDDPSGRASHTQTSIPVRPTTGFIGIKPEFDGSIDAGAEAAFSLAAIDRDGNRVAIPAMLRLVRERPDWKLVTTGSLARYQTVYRDEPVVAQAVTIPATGALRFTQRLDFGRYRLEVLEQDGLAATSIHFRAGWATSDSPDTPDKVDVSTDKHDYAPGETVQLHILSPFAGPATLVALTGRVQSLRLIDVPADGTTVTLPAEAAWGPGAYLTVHVFRGGNDGKPGRAPGRAIGLAWAGIDRASRTLALSIADPGIIRPRTSTTIPVHTAPGAWVTLAAIDEGILRLTNFATPDPVGHFLGQRSLGIDIRDDWGRLIAPATGEATTLRQGGDDGGAALPEIPQRTVALFTPPVQAGPDGTAAITLALPDFNGQVRLMAVAWQGNRVASTAQDMIVRDPLIAEPLLPRFLAPGDEARLGVLMQNVELPAGPATVQLSVDGPLAIAGDTSLTASLDPGAQVIRTTTLRATGIGRGVVHLAVTGPGGFSIQRESAILIRSARPPTTLTSGGELAPGAEFRAQPVLDRMLPGTALASLTAGGAVRYDVAALLQALSDYPLFCLEQATSKGLPLALLPPTPDRAIALQTATATVLDHQRFDGGFGLWSASGEAETWLSAYATEFLLRARDAGAPIPPVAITQALKYLAGGMEDLPSSAEGIATRAYYLYVLALGGQPLAGANRVMAENLDTVPTPLAKAQLAAALALTNDRPRAEQVFIAALANPVRNDWDADRGSTLRDQFAVATLLKQSALLPDRLQSLIARLPGADLKPDTLNTQEQAWAAAAAIVLGRDLRPTTITVDGSAHTPAPSVTIPLTTAVAIRNTGERPIWQTVSTTGIPIDPAPAARSGMRVTRKFLTLTGDPVDLDNLKQNTVFILLVEGATTDGQAHRTLLLQGLPAGWEIAGRLDAGKTAGLPWLGDLTATDAQPASDDRFAATMMLGADTPSFRVAVRLRAVTPGNFEIPGAQLADMYGPAIFARQATNHIKVLAAE